MKNFEDYLSLGWKYSLWWGSLSFLSWIINGYSIEWIVGTYRVNEKFGNKNVGGFFINARQAVHDNEIEAKCSKF